MGLTFGFHSRIDDRVQRVVDRVQAGNLYINRNQIGAVVGSQPFGGEGLSGTGPKAGGPLYLAASAAPSPARTCRHPSAESPAATVAEAIARLDARNWAARGDRVAVLRRALSGKGGIIRRACSAVGGLRSGSPFTLPGPTGESNRLSLYPKGHSSSASARRRKIAPAQAVQALAAGQRSSSPLTCRARRPPIAAGAPLAVFDGTLAPGDLEHLDGIDVVAAAGRSDWTRALRKRAGRPHRRDHSAGDRDHRAKPLCRRAASLHRHDGGRRQCQPARRCRIIIDATGAATPRRPPPYLPERHAPLSATGSLRCYGTAIGRQTRKCP